MKLLLIGILIFSHTASFAAFNIFQCNSKNMQITKSMPYKDWITFKSHVTNQVEDLTLASEPQLKLRRNGDIETFVFRATNTLFSLVITENSPNAEEATAVLYRLNINGIKNEVVEKRMKCQVE